MEPADIPYLILGAMTTARSETRKAVDDLIARGQERLRERPREAAKRGEAYISDMVERGRAQQEEFVDAVAVEVKRILGNIGVVTKADLEKLDRRISKLEKKI